MTISKFQRGVGMIEVLVALILLAIGVLGYVGLQVRAVEASGEALNRSQAAMIMHGLAENIRANQAGQSAYSAAVQRYVGYTNATTAPTSCLNVSCSSTQMATHDAYEAAKTAFALGIHLTMTNCPGVPTTGERRQCIFSAWGKTTLEATDFSACMSDAGVYEAQETCMMMEAY